MLINFISGGRTPMKTVIVALDKIFLDRAKAEEEKAKIEKEYKREIEIEVKSAKIEVAEKYQAQIEKLQQQHSAQIAELLLSKQPKQSSKTKATN